MKATLILLMICFFQIVQASTDKTIKVAIMDKVPFAWKVGAEVRGLHYDVAKKIAEKTGYKFEYELVPILRATKMLTNGDADFIILRDTAKLEGLKLNKVLLFHSDISLYSNSQRGDLFKNGIKGVIARLPHGCNELLGNKEIKWFDLQSYEQGYELLLQNRVDAVCGSLAFKHLLIIEKKPIKNFKVTLINRKPIWVLTRADLDKKKWQNIESATKALVQEGFVDEMVRKYENYKD